MSKFTNKLHPIRHLCLAGIALATLGCGAGSTSTDSVSQTIESGEPESTEVPPKDSVSVQPERPQSDALVASPAQVKPVLTTNFIELKAPQDATAIREESRQLASLLVSLFPGSPDAFEVKARIHLMIGETNEADSSWKTAFEKERTYIHAFYGRGEVASLRGDFEAAIPFFDEVLERNPSYSSEVYFKLAEAHHNLGDVPVAIEVLERHSEVFPDSAEGHLRLAQEFVANKDFARAKGSFEKTLALSPDLPKALEGLGRTLARLGDREMASEVLEKYKSVAPGESSTLSGEEQFVFELVDYSEKYKDAAQVFLAENEFAKAQLILEKSVILSGSNMDAWSSLLGLYQRTNQLSRAKSMSVVMCEKNKDNAGAFFTSGVIHAKSGDIPSAINLYDRVIELAPESDTGYTALARLLLQTRQDPKRIIELTQRAADLNPIAPNYELLGQAQAVNGKMKEARNSLAKAIDLDPGNTAYQQAMQQLDAFLSQQESPPK